MSSGVTVVIPTFPARALLLSRAIQSVQAQTVPADTILIVVDNDEEGAAVTRQRGLSMVQTEWTAFLDDDDEFLPHHLERLLAHAEATRADMVWAWFSTIGGHDPFPQHMGRQFDLVDPHQITVTTLVRTEAARAVGGFLWDEGTDIDDPGTDDAGNRAGEDFLFTIRMAKAGYVLSALNERTWLWHHDSRNTSGLPARRPQYVPEPNGHGPGYMPVHIERGKIVGFSN